jgi:hypothetical protein
MLSAARQLAFPANGRTLWPVAEARCERTLDLTTCREATQNLDVGDSSERDERRGEEP